MQTVRRVHEVVFQTITHEEVNAFDLSTDVRLTHGVGYAALALIKAQYLFEAHVVALKGYLIGRAEGWLDQVVVVHVVASLREHCYKNVR